MTEGPTLLFNLGDPRLRDDEREFLIRLIYELTRRDTGIACGKRGEDMR